MSGSRVHRPSTPVNSYLIIVLVKSFHTRTAIEQAAAIVGPDAVVMSLQNGLGHEEILAEVDFINGAVVRCGERSDVPTPVNQALVTCVNGIELWLKNRAPKA